MIFKKFNHELFTILINQPYHKNIQKLKYKDSYNSESDSIWFFASSKTKLNEFISAHEKSVTTRLGEKLVCKAEVSGSCGWHELKNSWLNFVKIDLNF